MGWKCSFSFNVLIRLEFCFWPRSVQLPFESSWRYLWLNYHTVHHLFPKLDFSHHYHAQRIVMQTAAEFGIQ